MGSFRLGVWNGSWMMVAWCHSWDQRAEPTIWGGVSHIKTHAPSHHQGQGHRRIQKRTVFTLFMALENRVQFVFKYKSSMHFSILPPCYNHTPYLKRPIFSGSLEMISVIFPAQYFLIFIGLVCLSTMEVCYVVKSFLLENALLFSQLN